MVKSAQLRAIALFETSLPEEVAVKQAVIRDYVDGQGLEVINFFAVQGNIEAGLKEAVRVAFQKKATNIILDSALTLRLVPSALINVIVRLLSFGLCLHIADSSARWDMTHLVALKDLFAATELAKFNTRSARIKGGLKRSKPNNTRRFGGNGDEQAIIAHILELHAQGLSLQKISAVLALSDIKTVRHKKWHPTTIKRIIDRTKKKSDAT